MGDSRYEPGPITAPGFYKMREEAWGYTVIVRVIEYAGKLFATIYDNEGNSHSDSVKLCDLSKSATYRRI